MISFSPRIYAQQNVIPLCQQPPNVIRSRPALLNPLPFLSFPLFRQLTAVVSAVLRSANPPANLGDFSISRASARRARAQHRVEMAASVRSQFVPPSHAVVHWDGKSLQVSCQLRGIGASYWIERSYKCFFSGPSVFFHKKR